MEGNMLEINWEELLDDLLIALHQKQYSKVREALSALNPTDIAGLLSETKESDLPLLFRLLPKELAAEVFVEMDNDQQEFLISAFSDREL